MTILSDVDAMDLAASPTAVVRPRSALMDRAADFLELAKPRMNMLVVGTTMVGFYLGQHGQTDWRRIPATLLGTALTAGGAGALNQFVERRFDAQMPRTRLRPLPDHRIQPAEALGFGVGLAIGGVAILALLVNWLTASLGAFTLLSYVLIYTPLKRRTTLNTLIGAVPGAIPPVMGWTATRGHFGFGALALFSILFVWQIPHFMAIAILYRRDYSLAGFRMLPVVDETLIRTGRQIVVFSLALIPVSLLPTVWHVAGLGYAIAAGVMGLIFLRYGIACAKTGDRLDARKLFIASIIYLPLLLTCMMLDRRM